MLPHSAHSICHGRISGARSVNFDAAVNLQLVMAVDIAQHREHHSVNRPSLDLTHNHMISHASQAEANASSPQSSHPLRHRYCIWISGRLAFASTTFTALVWAAKSREHEYLHGRMGTIGAMDMQSRLA